MRLVTAKMERAVEEVRAEGWKWVKAELIRDHSIQYGRIWPSDEGEDGEDTYSAADKARAGALVRVGYDGMLAIDRGYVHPDDTKAEGKRASDTKPDAGKPSGYSAALVEDLTAHRTAALRIELARRPAVALAATVHALALALLYPGAPASCLDINASSEPLERHTKAPGDSPAHQAMAEEAERWGDRLPSDDAELWTWCLDQKQELLLDLLAFLAALSVDAVQTRPGRTRLHDHADRLAKTLPLDMTRWWTPSVEGFYERLPKAALVTAVTEAKVTASAPFDSVKKLEAAKMAAKALAGSGWLPESLRPSL